MTQVDQKVVLELDQLVSDQQATLQVRIIPLDFCFTSCLLSGPRYVLVLFWGFQVYTLNVNMLVLFWILHRELVFPCFPSRTTLMIFDFKCTFWISYSDWTTHLVSTVWAGSWNFVDWSNLLDCSQNPNTWSTMAYSTWNSFQIAMMESLTI